MRTERGGGSEGTGTPDDAPNAMSAGSSRRLRERASGAGTSGATDGTPSARAPTRLVPLACLLATGALLGLSTNLAKVGANASIPPLALLAWSIAGASLVLIALAALRGELPPLNRRTLEYFVVAAFVTVAASNLIFFSAVPHVGAGYVSLAIAFPPLLTWLGALALGVERFAAVRMTGVVLALAGAAWIAARELDAPDADTFWLVLTLAGPVLLAIGNLYRTLRWPPGVPAESLAPGMLGAAAAMLLATGLLPQPAFSIAVPTGAFPYALVAAQSLVFALQFLLLFVLQRRGGPVYLSLLGSVGAVVAIPVAVTLLDERPPAGLAPGATLIALGIALLTFGRAKAPR